MTRESGDPLFSGARAAPGGGEGGDDPERVFSSSGGTAEPLASRMRPRTLDEFVGQEHIVGPGRLLRRAIQKDQLSSLIFSGPPGTGKTTLARVIANGTKSRFVSLNAVLTGVADIRMAIEEARRHREFYDRKTILFVDEVHRWNKSQQDALLPWVENGTVILIGATTENPFFEVNRALVSRSRVFLLKALTEADLEKAALAALADPERGYGSWKVEFAEGALGHLVGTADGDARSLLNALELAVETSVDRWPPPPGTGIFVSMAAAEESIQRRAVLYDKDGDYHYDAASALIKSIRGSDPDAALYWLSRMIYSGEDPSFAFRRMLISAAEDVGMADPSAIGVVSSCAQAFDRVGMPEGQFHLTLAALHLATAPKSNSALGYFDALKAVEEEGAEVPDHLKDANRDAKGFGHGEGYRYPHAYKDHWVAQQYLPESMRDRIFYKPGTLGIEGDRRDTILSRREAQLSVSAGDSGGRSADDPADAAGTSIWSAEGERKARWMARAEGAAAERLRSVRGAFFDLAAPVRADRVLVIDSRRGFYALEALRRSPEGTVAALVPDTAAKEQALRMTENLSELARPLVAESPSPAPGWAEAAFGFGTFDLVLACEPLSGPHSPDPDLAFLASLRPPSSAEPRLAVFEILRAKSAGLSGFLLSLPETATGASAFPAELAAFESEYGGGPSMRVAGGLSGEREALESAFTKAAGDGIVFAERALAYSRAVDSETADAWLSPSGDYGKAMTAALGARALRTARSLLPRVPGKVSWPMYLLYGSLSPR